MFKCDPFRQGSQVVVVFTMCVNFRHKNVTMERWSYVNSCASQQRVGLLLSLLTYINDCNMICLASKQ